MKKYLILTVLVVIALVLAVWLGTTPAVAPPFEQACTLEAKLCPDGSAVGRSGPNCAFAACPEPVATSTPPSTTHSSISTPIAIGTSATIRGTTIGVLELVEDSRCPVDVQCVWAGTVRVRTSIDALSRDFIFTQGQPQVVGGRTITLLSVTPTQKRSQQTVPLGDYRFVFTVY